MVKGDIDLLQFSECIFSSLKKVLVAHYEYSTVPLCKTP